MRYRKNIKYLLPVLLLSLLLWACARTAETPEQTEPEKPDYSYVLTEEQAQNYAGAVCHLLKREGENLYRFQYRNCPVSYADGRLDTDYDGMALEITSRSMHCGYLALDMAQSTAGVRSFISSLMLIDEKGEYTGWRCLLQPEGEGETGPVAMLPVDEYADAALLAGRGGEVPDFSGYAEAFFYDGTYYRTVCDSSGKPLPVKEWEKDEHFSGFSVYIVNGLQWNYVPLVGGDYYLLYEITDTRGNTYCSDLIPYQTEPAPVRTLQPNATVKWEKGQRQQLLLERDGIEIYLAAEKDSFSDTVYALKVRNNTDTVIRCEASNGLLNGIVPCWSTQSVTASPGKFVANDYGFSFGVADSSEELERITEFRLTLSAVEDETGKVLIDPYTVLVDMTEAWQAAKKSKAYFAIQEPAMDALAKEQTLLETEVLRVTMLGGGCLEDTWAEDFVMTFRVENLSQKEQYVKIAGLVVNGIFLQTYDKVTLQPGCIDYFSSRVSEYNAATVVGDSIETVELLVEVPGQEDWSVRTVQRHWIPVALESVGQAAPFDAGSLLWEQDGIRVGLQSYDDYYGEWILTLTNDSLQAVSVKVTDMAEQEELHVDAVAGPGQKTCFRVDAPINPDDGKNRMVLRFKIYDLDEITLLCESKKDVILEEIS